MQCSLLMELQNPMKYKQNIMKVFSNHKENLIFEWIARVKKRLEDLPTKYPESKE